MIFIIYKRGIRMTDGVVTTKTAASRRQFSAAWQIAVLAGLAALGTLATNILLPSLPKMAAALDVSSAAVTSAITIFLAVFAHTRRLGYSAAECVASSRRGTAHREQSEPRQEREFWDRRRNARNAD
jgi:hypothetical protein